VLAANTSFADFPRLASFHAGDNFMPRQLTKRGHRLVFSNGIVFLAVAAIVLLVLTGAKVDRLIPLYAIGVFTSFTLSQVGMAKHHVTQKEPGWRWGLFVNATGAALSFVVDIVIAATKFTHGAWLIVVLVPVMVVFLVRLARQYEGEDRQLEAGVPAAVRAPVMRKLSVLVFIDRLDLAAARALQFGRSLRPDDLRAVHFVVDQQRADELSESWRDHGLASIGLELVDCPDRRLTRSAMTTVAHALADGQTEVCVVLPDRRYGGLWRRVLHDQTAEAMARDISRLQHVTVTTVPFHLGEGGAGVLPNLNGVHAGFGPAVTKEPRDRGDGVRTQSARLGTAHLDIADVQWRHRVRVTGTVSALRVQPVSGTCNLECTLVDHTGGISVLFLGRRTIPGIDIGTEMTVEGMVVDHHGRLAILNPVYEISA
jgi:hypothetical protein